MPSAAFPRVEIQSIQVRQIEGVGKKSPKVVAQFFGTEGDETAIRRATGSMEPSHELVYSLNVNANNEPGAATTARTFVRVKNLFEPNIISIEDVRETSGETQMHAFADSIFLGPIDTDRLPDVVKTYAVTAKVEK